MPSSFYDTIPLILPFVMELEPRSVLDVGIGFGKYGFLFREYLDVNTQAKKSLRFDSMDRKVRIDGIEAHQPYVTDLQRAIYDTIYIGEALALLPTLDSYDLIFATDILEHFTKEEGLTFLSEALAKVNLGVLVGTPALHFEQDPIFGNPYEVHQSFWTPADFAEYPGADVLIWRRQLLAYLPRDGKLHRLPRPTLREVVGMGFRLCLFRLLGEVRGEVFIQKLRRNRR